MLKVRSIQQCCQCSVYASSMVDAWIWTGGTVWLWRESRGTQSITSPIVTLSTTNPAWTEIKSGPQRWEAGFTNKYYGIIIESGAWNVISLIVHITRPVITHGPPGPGPRAANFQGRHIKKIEIEVWYAEKKRLSTREKFKGDLYWKQCWYRVFSLRRYWR